MTIKICCNESDPHGYEDTLCSEALICSNSDSLVPKFIYCSMLVPILEDYEKFKRLVHQYFPTIFDTKPIALHLREVFNTNR